MQWGFENQNSKHSGRAHAVEGLRNVCAKIVTYFRCDERERERDTTRETERERDTAREIEREGEGRDTENYTTREGERDTERDTARERERGEGREIQ